MLLLLGGVSARVPADNNCLEVLRWRTLAIEQELLPAVQNMVLAALVWLLVPAEEELQRVAGVLLRRGRLVLLAEFRSGRKRCLC